MSSIGLWILVQLRRLVADIFAVKDFSAASGNGKMFIIARQKVENGVGYGNYCKFVTALKCEFKQTTFTKTTVPESIHPGANY
jgi:hypothetical protein